MSNFKTFVLCLIGVCIILLVRYYILLQYIPIKKIAPIKDGSLCSDIFEIYENNIPSLSISEKSYEPIPSSIFENTIDGLVILSIKNDGVLEYRINGVLIWSSDDTENVFWNESIQKISTIKDFDIFEKNITSIETETEQFSLTLYPFAIHKIDNSIIEFENDLGNSQKLYTFKTIWDINGWNSSFRPNTENKPYGTVFLISENRHIQVALLSNGDLVAIEKTSLSTPRKIKTSLLESYC